MAYFAKASKSIVIKANRETIGLVVVASAMTFALAYAVHSKPVPILAPPQQEWTGDLAELQAGPPVAAQALTSADLVVPKAQLALPAMAAHPVAKRPCDDPSCAKIPVPPQRRVAARSVTADASATQAPKPGLLHTLNPLNHLPPLSTVSRPFTYAGDVVSGWIKRF